MSKKTKAGITSFELCFSPHKTTESKIDDIYDKVLRIEERLFGKKECNCEKYIEKRKNRKCMQMQFVCPKHGEMII